MSPFGRVLVAMITPFTASGEVDVAGAAALATHLVDHGHADGLVLGATTGEAPTTSDAEKAAVLRAVVDAVGDRAQVLAGAGSYDTAHAVQLARAAEQAGAHGLLVVTPYYSRPTQVGVYRHFLAVADATELPMLMYDIPVRTGTAIELDTMRRLAGHPRIVGIKDVKYDLLATSRVLTETELAVYAGADELNLAWYAIGAAGVISTIGNLVGARIREMFDLFDKGEVAQARALHERMVPVVRTFMTKAPGTVAVKAALELLGLPAGPVRLPLVEADAALRTEIERLLPSLAI